MQEQSPDSTWIQIHSAMLSENKRSMCIFIVPVTDKWLKRNHDYRNDD